jgi:hypothetical protein
MRLSALKNLLTRSRLPCRLGRHRVAPHQAVISGPGLMYSKTSPATVVIRSVCIRPGCRHMENEQWVVPTILQKAMVGK